MNTPNDSDILSARFTMPDYGDIHFERVRQDRRWYYRIVATTGKWAGLTDAKHARETIAYWETKGWRQS